MAATLTNDHGHDYGHIVKTVIPAGEFKSKCLRLMDIVDEKQIELTITKRGKAIARLVPAERRLAPRQMFGALADRTVIIGDITESIDVKWDANE